MSSFFLSPPLTPKPLSQGPPGWWAALLRSCVTGGAPGGAGSLNPNKFRACEGKVLHAPPRAGGWARPTAAAATGSPQAARGRLHPQKRPEGARGTCGQGEVRGCGRDRRRGRDRGGDRERPPPPSRPFLLLLLPADGAEVGAPPAAGCAHQGLGDLRGSPQRLQRAGRRRLPGAGGQQRQARRGGLPRAVSGRQRPAAGPFIQQGLL